MLRNIIIISIMWLSLCACENTVPIEDLDFNFDKKVWLRASIKNGKIQYFMNETVGVLDDSTNNKIVTHTSRIYKNGELTNLLVQPDSFDLKNEFLPFVRFFVEDSTIKEGDSYRLEFDVPGYETLITTNSIPENVSFQLDSIAFSFEDFSNRYYSAKLNIDDDPNQLNYYRIYLSSPYFGNHPSILLPEMELPDISFYFSDEDLLNNALYFEFVERAGVTTYGQSDNRFVLELCQIDSVYYYSMLTGNLQEEMLLNPKYYSFEPINEYSNVVNGLGVFVSFSDFLSDTLCLDGLADLP